MVKDSYFQIRCTKAELKGIKADAKREGKTLSGYIMGLVRKNKRLSVSESIKKMLDHERETNF